MGIWTLSSFLVRHSLVAVTRNYALNKIQENNEAEIMQVVLDEARESYAEEIVVELKSESTEDLESNVERLVEWVRAWRRNHGFNDDGTPPQSVT